MLVITLGDPHGVTIELVSALLADGRRAGRAPIVLVGSAWQWRDQLARLGRPDPGPRPIADIAAVAGPGLYLHDVGAAADAHPAETLDEAARGGASVRALEWLKTLPSRQRLAVVTGPIDKHAAAAAGFRHPGQTEYFEELWRAKAVMTLAGPRLRVGLVTNHLPLRDVARSLNALNVIDKAKLFVTTLRESFGIVQPRVAVCGLNPHAGDQGLFGDEEVRLIAPCLERVREHFRSGAVITGPLPADTAFHLAYTGTFDGVLAMYHDQGLGPLKTVHFDDAINLSGGLPHFRASPDHGPARDLFLKGRASPASFTTAVDLALEYLAT